MTKRKEQDMGDERGWRWVKRGDWREIEEREDVANEEMNSA